MRRLSQPCAELYLDDWMVVMNVPMNIKPKIEERLLPFHRPIVGSRMYHGQSCAPLNRTRQCRSVSCCCIAWSKNQQADLEHISVLHVPRFNIGWNCHYAHVSVSGSKICEHGKHLPHWMFSLGRFKHDPTIAIRRRFPNILEHLLAAFWLDSATAFSLGST